MSLPFKSPDLLAIHASFQEHAAEKARRAALRSEQDHLELRLYQGFDASSLAALRPYAELLSSLCSARVSVGCHPVPQETLVCSGNQSSQSSSSSFEVASVARDGFGEGDGVSAVRPCPLATAKDYARQMERLFSQADDMFVALEDLFEKIYARRSPLGEFVFLEAGRRMHTLRGLRTELLEKLAELK